jgi:enterochelin esterase-like enzyme
MSSTSDISPSSYRLLAVLVVGAWLLAGCGAAVQASSASPDGVSSGAGVSSVGSGRAFPTATDAQTPGSSPTASFAPRLSPSSLRWGANPPSGLGFTYATPGWVTSFRGKASGVTARVVVWLPPEYALPSYAHRTFPVVQLLGGYPANVFGWMHGVDVVGAYLRARAAGMRPAVLVTTEINVEGRADLECLDAPGHAKVATWITRDVPAFVRAHFRVARPGGWGVMGFSMGGFCAPYLALTHPDVYRAAVAINGYLVPTSPQLPARFLKAHSLLRAMRSRPAVSIRWSTTHQDAASSVHWGYWLERAAAPPTHVTVVIVNGHGHATRQWSPYVWADLKWLVARLPRS